MIIQWHRIIEWHRGSACFWFRLCGVGLGFYDRGRRPSLFSERTGIVRVLRIGWLAIKPLGRKGASA